MKTLISVFLLHLYLFGYIGAALGSDQMCAIPTSDDSEFETVELIFEDEDDLEKKLNDPKMQEYLREHFLNNGGSCEEQETTTTITTTVTTGSAQPPTKTTDIDETDISTTNMETTEPVVTSQQTTQAKDTTETKMKTTEPAVTSAESTQAKVPTTETSTEVTTESTTTPTPTCPSFTEPTTGICKIVYDQKCYIWHKGGQKYTLEIAKQWCEEHGFNLGNIYDKCHYSYILETVGKTAGAFWTGMNTSFTSERHRVLLRSGEIASFSNDWWKKDYPDSTKRGSLLIEVKMKFPPPTLQTGITNEVVTRIADGAFCEKDI